MYRVIRNFKDAKDNDFEYKKSDLYPRDGFEPSPERLKYLSSRKNVIGMLVIQKIEDESSENNEKEDPTITESEGVELDALKKSELLEIVKSRGMEINPKWSKKEIIAMIQGADMDG